MSLVRREEAIPVSVGNFPWPLAEDQGGYPASVGVASEKACGSVRWAEGGGHRPAAGVPLWRPCGLQLSGLRPYPENYRHCHYGWAN